MVSSYYRNIIKTSVLLVLFSPLLLGCGQKAFLREITEGSRVLSSGDILVLSGGTVARSATPFPLHQISAFHSDGRFKSIVRYGTVTDYYMGFALSPDNNNILYTVDGTDRVERVKISDTSNYGNYIVEANLTGATLRTLASLSDGGTVIAESPTSIEKYDSAGTRVTTNFPLTLTTTIQKIRKISGGRFVAITNGGAPDSPRVYNNAGVLQTTIALGLACTTNCDPSDIVELSDGRFVVAVQAAALNSLELYSSSFAYIGQLYRNTDILQTISAITQTSDGNLIACSTSFNTCEKIQIIGSTGVRVGSTAFIDNASVMRQPTDIMVIP